MRSSNRRGVAVSLVSLLAGLFLAGNGGFVQADEPLHVRIDQLVDAAAIGPRSGVADDLTFLRRVTLDLNGRIPTIAETREFLADSDSEKRARAVDRLVASPDFTREIATALDVMLMERRGGTHVKPEEFRDWLQAALKQKKSYLQIATDLLAADGSPGENRPAAAFFLERDVEPNLLTREIGRMFFGIDVQCAQCHNHPQIDDYHQGDYFGLFAFVSRSSVFRPDAKQPALIGESADGTASFKSVFTERESVIGPRLPGGAEVVDASFATGDEYSAKPDKDIRGVPKFSRRAQLARLIAAGGNRNFDRNIANRFWALMTGRGLVHPVDHHHSANPAWHPELLELLAGEFAKSNYDIASFVREIALSQTYQRAYDLPGELAVSVEQARTSIPQLRQELDASELSLQERIAAENAALEKLDAALAAAKPVRDAWLKLHATAVEAAKKRDASEKALQDKRAALAAKQKPAEAVKAALLAAQAVAQTLPNSAELKAVVETLGKKSQPLDAEVAKLATESEALVKPAADLQAALAAAQEAEAPERQKVEPFEAAIREQRTLYIATREQVSDVKANRSRTRKRIGYLEQLVALGDAEATVARLNAAIPESQTVLSSMQTELTSVETQLAAAEATLKQRTADAANIEKSLASATELQTKLERTVTLLGESLASARQAAVQIGGNATLSGAIVTLTKSEAGLTTGIASAKLSVTELQKAAETSQAALKEAASQHVTASSTTASLRQSVTQRREQLEAQQTELAAALPKIEESSEAIVQQATERFSTAVLEPLSPEQFGWSALEATGYFDRIRDGERARLDKEKPLNDAALADPAQVAARDAEAREAAFGKLNGNVARFVGLFAAQKGQPQDAFFATVDQALFLANAGDLLSWLGPSGNNLTARLLKLETVPALTEELYLTVLTRQPTPDEIQSVEAYLAERKDDRPQAVVELAWALLTSVEFRFHH